MSQEKYQLFEQLRGEQLSSVEFVQNYLQLRFNGPTINIMAPIAVAAGERRSRSWDDQFRNVLCGQITKIVRSIRVVEGDNLTIDFEDASRISISLRRDDYDGPEAVYYHGFRDGGWGVI